jgi:hypothetical protein
VRAEGLPECKVQSGRAFRTLPFCIFHFAFFILHFFLFSAAPASAQVDLPQWNASEPIRVTAAAGNRWQVGVYEVWSLRGDCVIRQGAAYARCAEAVLWIDRSGTESQQPQKVIAYLEGNVEMALDTRPGAPQLRDRTWFGRLLSAARVEVLATTAGGKPETLPAIYWRGMERWGVQPAADDGKAGAISTVPPRAAGQSSEVRPAQFVAPAPPAPAGGTTSGSGTLGMFPATRPEAPGPRMISSGQRRVRVFPRSDVPVQGHGWQQADATGNHWVAVIDSGVKVIVEGVAMAGTGDLGTVDISTDRLVIWYTGTLQPDLSGQTPHDERMPLEFYMEGNVVFRQGERIIYASRMYYDVPNQVGTIFNADILAPAPDYAGLVRLHADMVQQTAPDRYFAQNGFITSSRIGEPGYRLQASNIYFEDLQQPMVDPASGQPVIDPATGRQAIAHPRLVTAENSFLFVGPVPIFYWPVMGTDLNDSTYYIRVAQMKQDNVFGTQVLTRWNGYELLGIRNKPVGTMFDLRLDYLSKRGLGHGGSFTYDRASLFDIPGQTAGLLDYWGIQDGGLDNLGQDRMNLPPEKSYRERLFWQHRQMLPYDLQFTAEAGWISDRNFLEEYYKSEWEQLKDQSTGAELKRLDGAFSWSVTADYGLNGFFTHTNWLPRADLFHVGKSLFGDTFTWSEHSSAAYGQFTKLQPPASQLYDLPFNYLPWEANSQEGGRFATRHEIDWPFQLGAVKVVPYLLGEAAYWGQDINGESLSRIWGQAGIRATLPLWSVDPSVNDELLNVHGIAHKVLLTADFFAADSNHNITELPLYDPLDDDSIEAFRRHYLTTTFGIASYSSLPPPPGSPWNSFVAKFDERLYALRSGLQSSVTSPSTEIADRLMVCRLGAEQRWQTKRGRPDNLHIIDWMSLDTHITFFPEAGRDNYGTSIGLLDYNYLWHVGDRLTLLSEGVFDFFESGQKIITVGGYLSRPPRGNLYAGFTVLEGPLHHEIFSLSYSYLMSPKWATTYGTAIDFGNQPSYAQNFSITRIGESLLVNFGFTVDPARDSIGVAFSVEPRFLPKNRLGNINGAQIAPAGAYGPE